MVNGFACCKVVKKLSSNYISLDHKSDDINRHITTSRGYQLTSIYHSTIPTHRLPFHLEISGDQLAGEKDLLHQTGLMPEYQKLCNGKLGESSLLDFLCPEEGGL